MLSLIKFNGGCVERFCEIRSSDRKVKLEATQSILTEVKPVFIVTLRAKYEYQRVTTSFSDINPLNNILSIIFIKVHNIQDNRTYRMRCSLKFIAMGHTECDG